MKRTSSFKRALAASGALAVPAALLYGAGKYFFDFTFKRCDDLYDWQSGLSADDPIKMIRDRAFFDSPKRESVEITSRDGLKLRGLFYDRGGDTTVLFCHGYRGGPEELTGIASPLGDAGYNALLIYQRGHKKSEGAFFTMGVKERYDVLGWIDFINRRKPGGKIALFGWSMGAATVMGALGEKLPANVRCAVVDCGYENLYDQLLASTSLYMPKLPCKRFFTDLLDVYCRVFRGFSIRLPLSRGLARCTVPVLFIHGSADGLVPYGNLDKCYAACASRKLRSSYAGAAHISSFGREPKRYLSELKDFIKACTE